MEPKFSSKNHSPESSNLLQKATDTRMKPMREFPDTRCLWPLMSIYPPLPAPTHQNRVNQKDANFKSKLPKLNQQTTRTAQLNLIFKSSSMASIQNTYL